jgi:hypothetical protein
MARREGLKSRYGMVSPEGVFHACSYYEHSDLAGELDARGKNLWGFAEGWIHVADGYWEWDSHGPEPTQKQIDCAFDWSQAVTGRKMPEMEAYGRVPPPYESY